MAIVSVITEGLSDQQKLAVVVFFVPMAMWFVSWVGPLMSDKAAEDGIASASDATKTHEIARWVRRAALVVFLLGLAVLAIAA
jgi:hypothetical protein